MPLRSELDSVSSFSIRVDHTEVAIVARVRFAVRRLSKSGSLDEKLQSAFASSAVITSTPTPAATSASRMMGYLRFQFTAVAFQVDAAPSPTMSTRSEAAGIFAGSSAPGVAGRARQPASARRARVEGRRGMADAPKRNATVSPSRGSTPERM